MKSARGSVLIVAVVIIALVVGIAGTLAFQKFSKKSTSPSSTQSQPTITKEITSPIPSLADETANWKTYAGKYFSFKYPSTWTDNTGPALNYPENLEVIGLV